MSGAPMGSEEEDKLDDLFEDCYRHFTSSEADIIFRTTGRFAREDIQCIPIINLGILDESAKLCKLQMLPVLEHSGCHSNILFGNPDQLEPFADEAIEDDDLVDQVKLSLFTRLSENDRSHTQVLE